MAIRKLVRDGLIVRKSSQSTLELELDYMLQELEKVDIVVQVKEEEQKKLECHLRLFG